MNRSVSTLEYNGIQSLILWTIATLFILFITLFIPDKHRVVEVLIFLIGVPLMGILVVSTAINLLANKAVNFSEFPIRSHREEDLPALMEEYAALQGSGANLPEQIDIIKFIF